MNIDGSADSSEECFMMRVLFDITEVVCTTDDWVYNRIRVERWIVRALDCWYGCIYCDR
jgi:hypothetical protein